MDTLSLPHTRIENDHATAVVVHQGAHVLSYQRRGEDPLLWHSAASAFELGRAIRGGVPVCWPWFGPHPDNPDKPMHGLVRTMPWRVVDNVNLDDGATRLRLDMTDDEATRMHWPHRFRCTLDVTVGPTLSIALTHENLDDQPVACSGALHTYLAVGDVRTVRVIGLDGCEYIDKVDDFKRKTQTGPLTIDTETDFIYVDTADEITVEAPAMSRRIRIQRGGSRSAVVWNPWIDKSKALADFGDEEYPQTLCVEAANAADDAVSIAPGESHTLSTTLRGEAL